MGSHNHQEARPSLNPQIQKQLTTGRMTHSSTLPIPCPWSLWVAPVSITWCSLGGKSCFPAHIGTQGSMLPTTTQPATFTLKHQGNRCPGISRTQGSHCSRGNRKHKPAGLVFLKVVSLNYAPGVHVGNQAPELLLPTDLILLSWASSPTTELRSLKPLQEIRHQGFHYRKAWFPCACSTNALPSWSPHMETRP
jgi:hypothetical protein